MALTIRLAASRTALDVNPVGPAEHIVVDIHHGIVIIKLRMR
jgi:hypothetical protein